MVLSHKRAPPARATNPKTGGRLTQAPVGTNPTTGQAVVIFLNFEFGGHVPEVVSTSRPTAIRRSVPRVVLRPQALLSQYGFPWYAVRSTVSFGFLIFLSAFWWCIFTFRPPRRAYPGSKDGRRSNVLVVVEFQVLSELGLCVFGAAPPLKGPLLCPRRV